MGRKQQGVDTLHSINWKKSIKNARDVLKNPGQRDEPIILESVSSIEQLLIDGELDDLSRDDEGKKSFEIYAKDGEQQ